MTTERRRDFWFKTCYLLVCGMVGAGSAWTAMQISQARLDERMKTCEARQTSTSLQVQQLQNEKLDRLDNDRADRAQDSRINDIAARLEGIQRSIDENNRLLVTLAARR